MIRWFIAAYIVIVLVWSAKATAHIGVDSNPTLKKFNYQTESSKEMNVQDPLPNIIFEDSRQMFLYSSLENSVG